MKGEVKRYWTTDEVKRMKEKDNEIDALKQTIEFDAACKTDLECRITDLENFTENVS